jgi:hypothetical protein
MATCPTYLPAARAVTSAGNIRSRFAQSPSVSSIRVLEHCQSVLKLFLYRLPSPAALPARRPVHSPESSYSYSPCPLSAQGATPAPPPRGGTRPQSNRLRRTRAKADPKTMMGRERSMGGIWAYRPSRGLWGGSVCLCLQLSHLGTQKEGIQRDTDIVLESPRRGHFPSSSVSTVSPPRLLAQSAQSPLYAGRCSPL